MLLSISEQLWAIFLTQGVLTGCGLVITFIAVGRSLRRFRPTLTVELWPGLSGCSQRISSRSSTSRSSTSYCFCWCRIWRCKSLYTFRIPALTVVLGYHHSALRSNRTDRRMAKSYHRILLSISNSGRYSFHARVARKEETSVQACLT